MATDFPKAIDEISDYLNSHAEIYEELLRYLESHEGEEENKSKLITHLNEKFEGNLQELDAFLRLIQRLASFHHRSPNFFTKIVDLLFEFKDKIENCYTNEELFKLFLHQEPIDVLLSEKGMVSFNDKVKFIINSPDNKDVKLYYEPGIEGNVKEFQQLGENHHLLCQIIRSDDLESFNQNTAVNKTDLTSKIPESPFETNAFLKSQKDVSIIQYVAFCGSAGIFSELASKRQDLLDSSCWEFAVHGRSDEIIQLLKNGGVPPPNEDNYASCTALSVSLHHKEITDFLQEEFHDEKPAEEHNDDDDDNAPPAPKHLLNPLLRAAIMAHNYPAILEGLEPLKAEAQNDTLLNELFQIACKAGFYKIAEQLVNLQGININKCGLTSALHKACNIGDINTVNLLLQHPEIDINLQSMSHVRDIATQDYDGLTALERAIRYGHNKIVELLLQNHADVNKKSRWRGNAPLHIAAHFNNPDAAELLLKTEGINPNVQCHDEYRIKNNLTLSDGRETPLFYSCRYGNKEVTQLLLKHGADPTIPNWEEKLPQDYTNDEAIKALFPPKQ